MYLQIGDPLLCNQIADHLLRDKGHYVQAINYPTVAKGEEKLKLTPTAKHTRSMMDKFVQDISDVFHKLDIPKKQIKTPRTILVH